jgi:hypothetical protein
MAHTETLADAVDAGQRLARILGPIESFGRVDADVAVSTVGVQSFAEIAEEDPTPACYRLRETGHGREFVQLDPFLILIPA